MNIIDENIAHKTQNDISRLLSNIKNIIKNY